MRVYELAAKIGTTSLVVMRLAEANEMEVYSPLSSLDADDVDALNKAFLEAGVERVKAEGEAAGERRAAKAQRARKAAEDANRRQAEELEERRQRAIAAYKASGGGVQMPETKKTSRKQATEEIKLDLPEGPKVKFDVSTQAEDDEPIQPVDDFDDDEDDENEWLSEKDRRDNGGKGQAATRKQQQVLAKKEAKKEAKKDHHFLRLLTVKGIIKK